MRYRIVEFRSGIYNWDTLNFTLQRKGGLFWSTIAFASTKEEIYQIRDQELARDVAGYPIIHWQGES